jgi:hypothetical protein
MTLIDLPLISSLRRNHGLEHASLNLLARRFPNRRLAGISFPGGFYLLGDLRTEAVREAVYQALTSLQAGDRHLAVHPGCGTNYAATGVVAGLLAWLGMAGAHSRREKLERLPLVIALVSLGVALSQPLGPMLQKRITTSGDPLGLSIQDIYRLTLGRLVLHRVVSID